MKVRGVIICVLFMLCAFIRPILSILEPVQVTARKNNNNEKIITGTKADFIFGKDRELFHASVDLKWFFGILTNKITYLKLFSDIFEHLRRFDANYDWLVKYREIASDILLKLRYNNRDTQLRYSFLDFDMDYDSSFNDNRLYCLLIECIKIPSLRASPLL